MEKLGKYELIVECPETKEDVIATVVKSTLEGTPAARINGTNHVVITNSRDVLRKNTPENIKKFFKNIKN